MQLPRKIQAGSAARAAEEEAKARRSESFSFSGGGRAAGQPLRLSSRGSSTPASEAVSREEYLRNAEIKVTGTGGQKVEMQREVPAAPAPPPAPAAPAPQSGFLGAVFDKLWKLFRFQ
jgi:hypothetical protein